MKYNKKLLPETQFSIVNFDEILEYHPTIKPLFLTSFLNYYFLKDENFFDSDQIILTSASSKTALSLAFLLKKNKALDQKQSYESKVVILVLLDHPYEHCILKHMDYHHESLFLHREIL